MTQDLGRTIATDEIPYQPIADGVGLRVVHVDSTSGAWTIMIHMQPGAVLPRHKHLSHAEIYILSGAGEHPQTGAFKTGDYVIEPAQAVHEPLVQDEEMRLVMRSDGPVAFLNDDDSTAFVMDASMLSGLAAGAQSATPSGA